jgi:Leucine-rich repeat (LRR) protein
MQSCFFQLNENSFEGLSRLTVLDMSKNHIFLTSPYFLKPCPGITWMSLANNRHIGKKYSSVCINQYFLQTSFDDLIIIQLEKNATWLIAPSLRTLVLSSCELNVFPPWTVVGLPVLDTLDISNNNIKVLPVLSVLHVCRIRLIDLSQTPLDCEGFCENAETKRSTRSTWKTTSRSQKVSSPLPNFVM